MNELITRAHNEAINQIENVILINNNKDWDIFPYEDAADEIDRIATDYRNLISGLFTFEIISIEEFDEAISNLPMRSEFTNRLIDK